MTYPPPPGVPGDPGQQPMPDPYAPGGGYPPPQGDPYGQPPTGDPYGQPPMDPYGQPPAADPYGQPPQDPYGSPPMSGVPMSPGAPGMAPDPYTQAPMPGMPGQQPSFLGGQPPQKSNLGWILGGVGGAAVLIIIVVIGIVVLNSGGSDDSAGGGGDETSNSATGEEQPSSEGGDSGGGSGDYKVTKGMCEQVDTSGVPSSVGLTSLDDITIDDEMYCSSTMSSNSSIISVKGKAFASAEEAEAGFDDYKETEIVGGDGLKEFTGSWDKGEISQYSNLEGTASVFILDGNMALAMYISATDSASNDEAKETAAVLAEGVFKVASS